MKNKRKIEIFSAGCELCQNAIAMIQRIACNSCDIKILDMSEPVIASRSRELGVSSVPAVAINGQLAGCCSGGGPDEETLRSLGLGQTIS